MAVYVYTYSGFPEERARKYYVCNFRKGKAHTYQVVPHLQRVFDRLDYDDKSEIEWEQFKQWRRAGHLYTENRSQKRSPLFDVDVEAVSEQWRPVASWFAGERAPADVDWAGLGRQLRRVLQRGHPLPEPMRAAAEAISTGSGESIRNRFEALRRHHLSACWYHLMDRLAVEDFEDVEGRSLDPSVLPEGTELGELALHELVRESRVSPGAIPEDDIRRTCAEAVDLQEGGSWSAIFEALGDESEWYDEHEGGYLVPSEALYDLQWAIRERLEETAFHHACAPVLEVERPAALHARFHAGAASAVIVEVADYPQLVRRAQIASELAAECRAGLLAEWTEEGVDALVRLLVDPSTGRPSPASPTAELAAECALWPVDEGLRRRLDDASSRTGNWQMSRLRDQIVVSTLADVSASVLSEVVGWVADTLGAADLEIAEGGTTRWQRGSRPLLVGELVVPGERHGRVRPRPAQMEGLREAVARARDGAADRADRRRLERGYVTTGDLRIGALADRRLRRLVRELLEGLTLSEFREECAAGWYGDLGAGEENSPAVREDSC